MILYKTMPTRFKGFDIYSEIENKLEISEKEILEIYEKVVDKKTKMDIIEIFVEFNENCHGNIRFFDASVKEAREEFPVGALISVTYNSGRAVHANFQDFEIWIS